MNELDSDDDCIGQFDAQSNREEAAYQFILAAYRRGENINEPPVLKRLKEQFDRLVT